MEAVTAVKIQMVYENALKDFVPLTPIAKVVKNRINNGPAFAWLPWERKKRAASKLIPAIPNARE